MTIAIRDDIAFTLLKKIEDRNSGNESTTDINLSSETFSDRQISEKDLLGHLDYLNQKGFINAEFSGDAYGGTDIVPSTVAFKRAQLTEKGKIMLERLESNPPRSPEQDSQNPVVDENTPFLQNIQIRAGLPYIYDARDIAVVVFRTMRDLLTTEAVDRAADELRVPSLETDNKLLQQEVADLWQDTNPLVSFLSRVRAPLNIDDELFLRRIRQEAGLPKGISPERAIAAVFAATKEELSSERIDEIGAGLPERIKALWHEA